jgi:hypothetical protein
VETRFVLGRYRGGVSLHWDFADSISGDLLHVTDVIWDEKTGLPNEKAGIDGSAGLDLLLIESIWVGPKFVTAARTPSFMGELRSADFAHGYASDLGGASCRLEGKWAALGEVL